MPESKANRKQLRAQVRRSRVMGAELRRYWVRVLPYLSERECARLQALLDQESATEGSAHTVAIGSEG